MFDFSRSEKVLLVLMVIGLVGAVQVGLDRHEVESANRNVEIIVDGRDLLTLSNAVGLSPVDTAQRLKGAGATCLAASEISLGELERRGSVTLLVWEEDKVFLSFADSALAEAAKDALMKRFPGVEISLSLIQTAKDAAQRRPIAIPPSQKMDSCLIVKGNLELLKETALLLDPEQVKAAQAANLRLAARLINTAFFEPESITFALSAAEQAGADLMIFDEEEVLGYDGAISYSAAEMKRLGLTYGWIELAQQYGEQNMRRHMWDSMVRVHGIAEKELPKLNREQILARMARAARERNIRACYARLLLRPQKDLLKYNADYLAELTQRLRGAGLTTGKASPYPAWNTAPWMFLLLGLGIAAGATLLAGRLLPLGGFGRIVVFLLFLILLAICKWIINKPVEPVLIRQAWSLLAGLTFPSLGLILAWQKMAAGVKSSELSVQSKEEAKALNSQLSTLNFGRVITAIGLVIEVSIFSFIGGLFIVGMLSETRFIVGAEQFRGVKLLLVTPFLLLTAAMAAGLTRPLVRVREWKKQVNGALRAFVGQPLLVGESILLLVILGALGILLLRSGNISSAAPAIEHQARAWLESSFWVRPRTKEFLLGHPALFIAALIWLTKRPLACGFGPGQQRLIPALLLVAALGQASIANTFSHLHTPLSISLLRTINGVWLGILVGIIFMIVWLLVRRLLIPAAEVTTTADSEP